MLFAYTIRTGERSNERETSPRIGKERMYGVFVSQRLSWMLNEDPEESGAAAVTAEETCGHDDCDPAKDG